MCYQVIYLFGRRTDVWYTCTECLLKFVSLETIILTVVGFLYLNVQDELKGDYETILVALCGSDN